jgi:hypothetical protein
VTNDARVTNGAATNQWSVARIVARGFAAKYRIYGGSVGLQPHERNADGEAFRPGFFGYLTKLKHSREE